MFEDLFISWILPNACSNIKYCKRKQPMYIINTRKLKKEKHDIKKQTKKQHYVVRRSRSTQKCLNTVIKKSQRIVTFGNVFWLERFFFFWVKSQGAPTAVTFHLQVPPKKKKKSQVPLIF
jgi:hypothetical protein